MSQYGSPVLYMPEGAQFDVYTAAQGQRYPLGQKLELPDGRIYRFARNGTSALAPGRLVQSEVPDGDHDTLAVPSSSNNVVGSRTMTVTNGSDTIEANLYRDGYAVIEAAAGAGDGYLYKIDAHGELTASVDVDVPLQGGYGLRTALNTSDTVTLVKSPYADVIIHPSSPTAMCVGVPAATIAASGFGWVQTHGPCAVLIDGTVIIGLSVMASNGTDGSVEAWGLTEAGPNTEISPAIGTVMEVAPTTGLGLIYLTIE